MTATCRRLALIRPICPPLVPKAPYARSKRPPGFPGPFAAGAAAICLDRRMRGVPVGSRCRYDVFTLEAGAPGRPSPRPPRYVHLVVYAGQGSLTKPTSMFSFPWPSGRPVAAVAGLFVRARQGPLLLGRRRWGGRTGTLVLAPRFPIGGEMSDHLIFRWSEKGVERAFSLHAWEPFPEAVATLRAVLSGALARRA